MTAQEPSDPPATSQLRDSQASEVSLARILAVLLRGRRIIIAGTIIGMSIALALALTRDRLYMTSFSFVPQAPQDPGRAGLASLAGQFGVSLGSISGAAQSPQFYEDLLRTREILGPIAADTVSVDGAQVAVPTLLRVKGQSPGIVAEKTMRALRTKVISSSVAMRTTGVVSVRVRTKSPTASLEIAQRLVSGLNQFNLLTRQSQAGEERRFVEKQLATAREALRAAEDSMTAFLTTNRQFGPASALSFERDRRMAAVNLQRDVVSGLAQNFEDARIREVRDTPVLTVIERPTLAVEPEPRGRVKTLLAGTMIGFFVGALAALLIDTFARLAHADGDAAVTQLKEEWRRLRRRS